MDTADRFAFGENWQRFIDTKFDEQRVTIAQRHLLEFLESEDLAGRRMIDIGCGSGLHSLAAIRAGVRELHSFDFDPASTSTTHGLYVREGTPTNWRVEQGSVLDRAYLAALGKFDIVYSWGVLHHTGNLWQAFENAASLVAPSGVLYVALYDAEVARPSPEFWLSVKERYNRGGSLTKRALEFWQVSRNMAGQLKRGKNPITLITGYRKSRGMAYMTDVRDWLGGWPMEYSTVDQVTTAAAIHGLQLVKLKTGEACAEYLFASAE